MIENSFDVIKNGINNENSDKEIIDILQEKYPFSKIENNIFLIEETRHIIENPKKSLSVETKLNHFLVKFNRIFIDIENGRLFTEYKEKTYANCNHGLCQKLGTLILKNTVKNKDAYIPNVLIATNEKSKENKPIRIRYQNENKKQQVWEFGSQEINECMRCIDEGYNDRQIAVALFCPRDCIQKLIKHIDINQKMNGRQNGDIKNKRSSRMDSRRTGRKR